MHNIYLEGEWNTDTGSSGKQQTMRGKTRTTINEKMARVTACCWDRMLQKRSDERRHGLPEATKTTLVTGTTEHFSREYQDGHGIPVVSDFFYFKLLGCISGCLEESQYSLPQWGIQSVYWEKEALVSSQSPANAFVYLSICCTPPHPSPPAQQPFSHEQDADLNPPDLLFG